MRTHEHLVLCNCVSMYVSYIRNIPRSDSKLSFRIIASLNFEFHFFHFLFLESKIRLLFLSFSFLANSKKLFNTSTSAGELTAVNGLRVISMFWVILGHTYDFIIIFLGKCVLSLQK